MRAVHNATGCSDSGWLPEELMIISSISAPVVVQVCCYSWNKFLFLVWSWAPTCCEAGPVEAGSGAPWRCEPAVWARASLEAEAAPGATHQAPPGKQAPPLVPPEPPGGLAGRLGEQATHLNYTHKKTPPTRTTKKKKQLCCCLYVSYHIPWSCRWWGFRGRRGSVRHSVADHEPGPRQHSFFLKGTVKRKLRIRATHGTEY